MVPASAQRRAHVDAPRGSDDRVSAQAAGLGYGSGSGLASNRRIGKSLSTLSPTLSAVLQGSREF